jgi:RND family efflux transporter MFP subunit
MQGGPRRRVVGWAVGVGLAAVTGALAFWSPHGGSTPQVSAPTATATRGDVTATVGGVGRISVAGTPIEVPAPGAGSGGAAAGGSGTSAAPADAVFARASGHVRRLLVAPNERVSLGQLIAEVDDGGVAAAALAQAESDYATAVLEAQADAGAAEVDATRAAADLETLRGGTPAARARAIAIARRNLSLARERLTAALAPAPAADVGAARAEVARAEADLAALRSAPASSPEALTAAQQAVSAAEQRIAAIRALTAPPDPVELASAQLELDKARADLAALTQPPPASSQALAAAEKALDAAYLKLQTVLAGSAAADRHSARLDVQRAESELRALESGPSPTALAAAGAASDASAARLAFVRSRPRVMATRALLASARAAAGMLEVRALTAGTVTALLTAPGAPVDPSTPIARVADLDNLMASVDLSEFDVARVHRGQKAIVSVDALDGRRAPGRVRFVALTGSDAGGVVSFPVQVAIRPTEGLRAGLNVSVRIILAQRTDVVRVPLEAVSIDSNDESVVTVVDGSGRQTTRTVTVGLEDAKNVEILSGLRAGEQVALPADQGQAP